MQLREFGEFLYILRMDMGATVIEVASRTGVSSTIIYQLEAGIRRSFPQHETMKHLAEFFDFEFQYIPEQMLVVSCPKPPIMQKSKSDEESYVEVDADVEVKTLTEYEKDAITMALDRNEGNRYQTAKQLGIGERTLYRKLKEYVIDQQLKEDNNEQVL